MDTPLDAQRPLVLDRLVILLREVIGEDWADELDIGLETSFSDDLELESIEFVALSERLQQEWGAEVDFMGWLAELELDEILALRVGDVVERILQCR